MSHLLITGIAGGLARLVAQRAAAMGHQVVGVDYRASAPIDGVDIRKANYNKTAIEDVFRSGPFDAVLHLGRVGNLKESLGKRFDLNVIGSQKLMNLCLAHKVPTLIVLSTFHIYGAHPANHIPISESDPLRAGIEFPQIADAIQLDNMSSTWVYQYPEVRTVVLRPTNVVGPTIQNTMSRFLRARRVPVLMGFNPMTQFVHEDDLANAVFAALLGTSKGVYNVAGSAVIPWREALRMAKAETFALPSTVAKLYMKAASPFPEYLLNFFMYPCVISDALFRNTFAWTPNVSIHETIESTVRARRAAIS